MRCKSMAATALRWNIPSVACSATRAFATFSKAPPRFRRTSLRAGFWKTGSIDDGSPNRPALQTHRLAQGRRCQEIVYGAALEKRPGEMRQEVRRGSRGGRSYRGGKRQGRTDGRVQIGRAHV